MIESKIQIDGGPVLDLRSGFGFIYLDADERTAPDEKEDAVTSYAGEAGEHRDGRTVLAPFDYTARFLVEAPNRDLVNVNSRIAAFNDAIRETVPGSDIRRKREIAFYNLHNRVKIVGFPELVSTPKTVYHSRRHGELEFAEVELKIRVSNPGKCAFDMMLGPALSPSNLVLNSAFYGPGNWVKSLNGGEVELDTAVTLDGRNSVRIVNQDGLRRYNTLYQYPDWLAPGQYTSLFYARYEGDIDWVSVELRLFDSGGNRTVTYPLGGINAAYPSGAWYPVTAHFTVTQADIVASAPVPALAIYSRSSGTAWVNGLTILKGNIAAPQWQPSILDNINSRADESQSIMTLDLYEEDNTPQFPLLRNGMPGYGLTAGDGGVDGDGAAQD